MAVTKFLARDVTPTVKISSTYTAIAGIKTLAHSPSKVVADSTDFDSAGHAEHVVVQRGDQWTLSGDFMEDVSSGVRDPGQEALVNASHEIGLGSTVSVKLTSPFGNTVTFDCSVETTGPAGGHNDLATFQAVLEVTGAPVYGGQS
jgi:predicted secreted protein